MAPNIPMKAILRKLLERAGLVRHKIPVQVDEFQGRSATEVFTLIHDRKADSTNKRNRGVIGLVG